MTPWDGAQLIKPRDNFVTPLPFEFMPFTLRNIPGTYLYHRLSLSQCHSAAGRIGSIEESNDVGNRTHDRQVYSIIA
jgi:hypothetical protein